MARQKKSFKEVVEKEYPEFVNDVVGLNLSDLESRISTYAKESEKVSEEKANNPTILDAKAELSLLLGPYKDTQKALRLKMKYLISLVKEKGGQV